jgi:predicted Zn-dependent peptidase
MTSKLYQAVREKQGLAYSVFSSLNTQVDSGNITIYAGTDPKKVKRVINIIKDELVKIKKQGVKKSDIDLFKTQVRGQLLMGSDDIENRMTSLGVNEMVFKDYRSVERVIKEVEAVNEKSIKAYLKQHFDLEKMAVVLMGPKVSVNKSWLANLNFAKAGRR